MAKNASLKIFRGDKSGGELVEYTVPREPGMVVLDAIHSAQAMHAPDLAVSATCIRVPIERAHSESLNLTFEESITPDAVREILAKAPGVEVVDDVEKGRFPMPLDASGRDNVLVGRIRQDVSQQGERGIELFLCGDQLRKGAALNTVQILELITK